MTNCQQLERANSLFHFALSLEGSADRWLGSKFNNREYTD